MSNHTRCAACRFLRKRCPQDCIFAPHFPSENTVRFACVHKIYGASNVSKMLQQLPFHLRAQAADSMFYEAQTRLHDPIYGCVGIISQLQHEISVNQLKLARTQAQIAFYNAQQGESSQIQPQNIEAYPPNLNSHEQDSFHLDQPLTGLFQTSEFP